MPLPLLSPAVLRKIALRARAQPRSCNPRYASPDLCSTQKPILANMRAQECPCRCLPLIARDPSSLSGKRLALTCELAFRTSALPGSRNNPLICSTRLAEYTGTV